MRCTPSQEHSEAVAKRPRRIASLLFVFVFALFSQANAQTPPRTSKPSPQTSLNIPAASKSVVSLIVYDKSGKPVGQGSGFFVTSTGRLLTNFHVIDGVASVVAKSSSGTLLTIEGILGVDQENDLAVLQVSGRGFTPLPLGNSDAVRVGDRVVAIGSPLGLENTISDGLISGIRELGRSSVFQTTAAVSPGSSGGVLLNTRGEAIGVTTFQLTGGQNLNFAVPSNYAKPLLKSDRVMAFVPNDDLSRSHIGETSSSFPRYWTSLENYGSTIEVRIDGDSIYEQSTLTGDGKILRNMNLICETKRHGDRWTGRCKWRYSLVAGSECNLELDETISSVGPTRIEGQSQKMVPASSLQDCPQPGTGEEHFVYVPQGSAEEKVLFDNFPRAWTELQTGSTVIVRFADDYLYWQTELAINGTYARKWEENCEAKRQGSLWAAKCHGRVWLNWESALYDNVCLVERNATVTSVSAGRIEGEVQWPEVPRDPSKCPTAGTRTARFALVPKY